MERILADTTATGQITAYYLHGPDLAVKIDPANPANIVCYHADASGNIVRLTDKDRAPVAQYAYSDYGRPFAATAAPGPTDTNPYRFVGSQGVMEEPLLPGLYFMRARYYLADAGVFLSTDPVKNIGPGWKPEAYGYGGGNPVTAFDPKGTSVIWIGMGASGSLKAGVGAQGSITSGIIFEPSKYFSDFNHSFGFYHTEQAAVGGGFDAGVAAVAEAGVDWDADELESGTEDYWTAGGSGKYALGLDVAALGKFGNIKPNAANVSVSLGPQAGGSGYAGMGRTTVVTGQNIIDQAASRLRSALGLSAPQAANYAQANNRTNSTITSTPTRAPASTSTGGTSGGGSTYTIRAGDTLSAISARTGISVSVLASSNNISNPNVIRAGATLSIPSGGGGGSSGSSSSGTGSRPGTTSTTSGRR